jgi:methyl-accepting chemotaxis protein
MQTVGQDSVKGQIPWQHSLGAKLVVAFLALALIPLAVVTGITYIRVNNSLQETTTTTLAHNVTLIEASVEQWLGERVNDLQQWAEADALHADDLDAISAVLKKFQALNDVYEAILLIDSQGETRYVTDGNSYVLADRDYFQQAMQGESIISDVVLSRVSGQPVFVVAVPLRNGDEIAGVLAASVKMDTVAAVLNSIRLGESGETYLINHDGYFITPSRFTDYLIAEGFIRERAELEMKVDSEGSRDVLAGNRGSGEFPDYRGIMVLSAYTPIEVAGQQWGLLSEIDSAEAFAASAQLRNLLIVALLLSTGLVTVIALWISRSITLPVRMLRQTAGQLAAGDIQQQITHSGKDEVGQLAEEFRRMITYQQQMAEAASLLAEGDLAVQVTAQSEKDVLGNAFQQMVGYQQSMAKAADLLAVGDLAVKVTPKSQRDVLGTAFQQMIGYQQEMATAIEQIGNGNLTVEVTPYSEKDVLGNAFQTMIIRLRKALIDVQGNAHRLLASSQQLAQVSDQASDATQQITQTIEMMSGTTQQVAQTIGQVALGAAQQAEVMERSRMIVEDQDQVVKRIAKGSMQQAQSIEAADKVFQGRLSNAIQQVESATTASDQAVVTAVQAAQSGSTAVTKTITGINAVAKTSDQVTQRISEMGKRSNQIGAIVKVINEIAERTNLLSLNAAIEAARAGDHGKGFAVVADEVRKLADRSAKSAEEITELVRTVQDAVSQAVAAMSENARQVQQNLATAADAENALSGIQKAMSQVGGQMGQLQNAVSELSSSSHDVMEAMQQVAHVIEENMEATSALSAGQDPLQRAMEEIASVAEENSAAAEEVAASAEENSAAVDEISAMTRSVNTQIEDLTATVQALSAMATDLRAVTNTFRLTGSDSMVEQIESFKQAHLQWTQRLKQMQKGKLDLRREDVGTHEECRLGEWYYGLGQTDFGHLPEFVELEQPHRALHQIVHQVIAAYQRRDMTAVDAGIYEVDQLSRRIVDLLDQLERRVSGGAASQPARNRAVHRARPAVPASLAFVR